MPRLLAALAASLLAVGASAHAAELRVTVKTPAGAPVANAVVSLYPAAGDFAPQPETLELSQQNIMFAPYVLVAPVGSTISFPNRDKVRHHVYSFSPAHRFELKLYGHEEHRSETFDRAGVVAVGCNIHDRMAAYIDVVDTRFAAKTDESGVAVIDAAPAGPFTLKVWHPFAKAPGATVTLAAGAKGAPPPVVTLDLRPPPPGKQTG